MGFITALSATGLAAGLAFTGVSAGNAATSSITLPDGGVLEHRVTTFCNRVPDLLKRVDKASERISGDADTKGSLEWLKARKAKAESNHHPRVVKRIERRIERRTERLAKLPEVKQKLTQAQGECATLDLPAPSGS
jgi:hypothetical protein